jgi:nicotinic acetylcholine receptor, invertebrate
MQANAMIIHNGSVFWPIPTRLKSTCQIDVTYFPYDEQECKLKFGSWTYNGYQVSIEQRNDAIELSNYVPNGEWDLLDTSYQVNIVRYACCPEPFPDITFYVRIRRRILYYLYSVVFPCVMLSILTLLVFCLPPESGEKIALGITVLLAFSVFMLAIAESMPETSEYIPLISTNNLFDRPSHFRSNMVLVRMSRLVFNSCYGYDKCVSYDDRVCSQSSLSWTEKE